MRMMLRFTIPVERGNRAVADGSLARAFEALLSEHKPEAAYFFVDQGKRGGLLVFDIADVSELPRINEPLFAALDAAIEITPVLTADDLKRGIA
jgi:hypothetical protein